MQGVAVAPHSLVGRKIEGLHEVKVGREIFPFEERKFKVKSGRGL